MRLRPAVRVASTDYGAVALDERTGRYYQVNSTAACILDQLNKEGATVEMIAERVVAEFKVDYQQAQIDVETYCRQLRKQGLLQ
jgi:hypothetical protein